MWPTTRLRFDSSRSLVRDCQEDAEIGKFRNLILPTDRNCPWGENHLSPSIWKKFTCHQTLVHCLMDSFSSHTLVQLLYNLHLQDVERSELNDPINSHHFDQVVDYKEQWSHYSGCLVPSMFITGSEYNVSGPVIIMTSARGTRVWMWIHARAVTVTEEYWYHLRL